MHECPSRCTSSQRSAHSFRLRRKPSQPDETSTGPRGEPSAFPVGRAHLHVELLQAARANEPPPATGDTVLIHYACRLASTGGCVDSSRSKVGTARAPLSVVLGSGAVVEGMEAGLRVLGLGALARLFVPHHLAYGARGAGIIPPCTDLAFEVEVLGVNERRVAGLPTRRLRALLARPVAPAADAPFDPARPLTAVTAAPPEEDEDEGEGEDEDEGEDDGEGERGEGAWVRQLRSPRPLPTPECARCLDLLETLAAAGGASGAAPPGEISSGVPRWGAPSWALALARAPHGTRWDGSTPLVLTGVREGWTPRDWGWRFWTEQCGDDLVLSKQRAPIFEEDRGPQTLVAESSLREYVRYARRPAHRGGVLLYMNGLDVFASHPELWDDGVDQMPGSIDNLTRQTYTQLHAAAGLGAEAVEARVRGLVKLFIGPAGAVTRMHQDNYRAHAWLHQLEGRKLYVLCAPDDEACVRGMEPLDEAQRRRSGARFHATVLQPGETLVVPEGWWHYAASLTPSVTLMCNFYDHSNLHGLRRSFYSAAARALDETQRRARAAAAAPAGAATGAAAAPAAVPRRVVASVEAATRAFDAAVGYRVVHAPFVFLRGAPDTQAPMVAIAVAGEVVHMGAERDGWLRTARPVEAGGERGWALRDGAPLGLGLLLEAV